jgi:hypothetical protein
LASFVPSPDTISRRSSHPLERLKVCKIQSRKNSHYHFLSLPASHMLLCSRNNYPWPLRIQSPNAKTQFFLKSLLLTTPVKEGRKRKPFVTKWKKKKKSHLQEAYPERVEKSRTQATWKILRRWHLEESWATALSSYLHQHHACCVSPPQFEWKFSFFDSGIAHKSVPFSLSHTPAFPPSLSSVLANRHMSRERERTSNETQTHTLQASSLQP